ncbi:NUDIX hydrolase [Stratiformator vulcanicus]|uniref:Isopentenyl-diphosphate Delta-isomerase n=1 Tax=Stratiformator vulcanicus TaxID=2527980 RepID=A0A517QZ63_9PLAN|nr:NUDIX domain-containing protein [Stratiformator vulcanicus]QDT36830.1 Isopentenyl-diphosphate Delta-isomerase [Stratiformator vulcanicus]
MAEELFDVVDEHDHVQAQLPRSEVHRRNLLHRAVSIFVFNTRGELLLQMRSASKDQFPNCWTSSASGHVTAGDDYDETAHRELEEELGLTCDITRVAKFDASPDSAYEFTVLYKAVTDDAPVPDPEEISDVKFASLDDWKEQAAAQPELFTPPFRLLLDWYMERGTNQ